MARKYVSLILLILLSATQLHSKISQVYPKKYAQKASQTDPLGVLANFKNYQVNSLPDTVRLLALRAEFVEDNLATTTGNGRFDYSSESEYAFDRPPHDKTYFDHQLIGLSNYFKTVSKNRLNFVFDVFPAENQTAYQLQNNMIYYSGEENEEVKAKRWAELLSEVTTLALDDPAGPDFTQYDIFIVFHAGVGQDFSFDLDNSPYDIQSVFLDFESLSQNLGNDDENFQGIKITDDFFIKEGIILPEAQNQEGYNLGLLGTMTLLVGSHLGMPNLYNTEDGSPGIGRWGLMDQGSYNLQGIIPAEPCAWTKVFMGWEEPVVLAQGTDLRVGVSKATSATHLYKIPITAQEYFLIENRQKNFNGDGVTFGRDVEGRRVQIDTLGNVTMDDGFGIATSIDEYDFGLPGSGILIWHVDETVIRENLATNTINNNPVRRGVDLVECDGAQDIGFQYNLLSAGYGTESGDYWDPYWSGNVSHKIVNGETEVVELSSTTMPNSFSNDGAKTHIKIYGLGKRDSVMTFSVSSDLSMTGFPIYAGKGFQASALLDVNLDGEKGVVAVCSDGSILGWKNNGEKIIPNEELAEITDIYGKQKQYDFALMAKLDQQISLSPIAYDVNGDGYDDIIVISSDGEMSIIETKDDDSNGLADLYTSLDLNAGPSAGLMGYAGKILVGDTQGRLHVVTPGEEPTHDIFDISSNKIVGMACANDQMTAAFNRLLVVVDETGLVSFYTTFNNNSLVKGWDVNLGVSADHYYPVNADFDGSGEASIVIVGDNGFMAHIKLDGTVLSQQNCGIDLSEMSAPALGDMDSDGLPEILLNTPNGFYALETSGVESLNFPVLYQTKVSVMSPLWHLHNSQQQSLVNQNNMMYGFDSKGKATSDFPLATAGSIEASLLIDLDNDRTVDIFVLSDDGFLYGWDLDWADNDFDVWSQFGGDAFRTFSFLGKSEKTAMSSELMPEKMVFCYPNPTENNQTNIRYFLTKDADLVTIKLYDLAGDFVSEFSAPEVIAGDHKVVWDVSNIESGVYLARVEANAGSQQNLKFIKIAVVK